MSNKNDIYKNETETWFTLRVNTELSNKIKDVPKKQNAQRLKKQNLSKSNIFKMKIKINSKNFIHKKIFFIKY